mmetsp:Transcript_27864/g.49399  ORF Transcript_27864/g.49399 Transcript_27864/m.49399 type:complete len:111 (-) Transcript_27864:112-444(-)
MRCQKKELGYPRGIHVKFVACYAIFSIAAESKNKETQVSEFMEIVAFDIPVADDQSSSSGQKNWGHSSPASFLLLLLHKLLVGLRECTCITRASKYPAFLVTQAPIQAYI